MTIPSAAVSKRPSAAGILTSPAFVLLCLHGRSLVVVLITPCFGMKSQSKYASVCLAGAAPLSCGCGRTEGRRRRGRRRRREKKSLQKHVRVFFCSFFLVCKLVLEPGMCSGRFVVLAYSFFMSSRWLNTRKSTQLLFRMNSWSVRNRPIKATCHSFFSAICSNFTPDFWNNAGNSAVEALL